MEHQILYILKLLIVKKTKDNTVRFEFGTPTTSSTTDYTSLNKDIFSALNGDQKSVCIVKDSKLHCFDNNNYTIEKDHIQQVFNDGTCSLEEYVSSGWVIRSVMNCYTDNFSGAIFEDGAVEFHRFKNNCQDFHMCEACFVRGDGTMECSNTW